VISIVGDEGDVQRRQPLPAHAEPKFRFAALAEARPALHFHDQFDTEGRERAAKELLALVVIADGESDVIDDHGGSRFDYCLAYRIICVQRNNARILPEPP
jgi:hypothetical protein